METPINQDLQEFIVKHRKNFNFEHEEKSELILPKPKGSLKFVPIEQWTPEYHNSIIQYQPTPLNIFQEDEEEDEKYSNEEESESDESSSISADEMDELSEKLIIKTERKRQTNLERIGLYEKIMLETEKIQKQTALTFIENSNVDSSVFFS